MFPTLWLAAGVALAQAPLTNPRVYLDKDGHRATVASVSGTQDRCVLAIRGIAGELDGLVLDCRAERVEPQVTYFITRRGREERAMRTYGDGSAQLGLPGAFTFSEAETKKEDLAALWSKHQAQAAQLAALAKFDRPGEVAAIAKEVNTAVEPLNRACGTQLAVTVDWSAAPDEVFKATRPQDGCLKVITVMQEWCGHWKVVRSTFTEKLATLRCTFGEEDPRFSLEGKSLVMSSNQLTVRLPGAFETWAKEAL